jgi:signal transduction histidine kinase
MEQYDKAIDSYKQGYELATKLGSIVYAAELQSDMANVYVEQKRYKDAFMFAFSALPVFTARNSLDVSYVQLILARAYVQTGRLDSALFYGKQGLKLAESADEKDLVMAAHQVLSQIYSAKHDFERAYYHYERYTRYSESLFSKAKTQQAAFLQFSSQISQKENEIKLLEKEKEIKAAEARKQQILFYALLAGIALVLALLIIVVRSYKSKQRANLLLERQKVEIQRTLDDLKSTQAQLVQSEKMASLGELTAGIAHEIQNPLNFVNNFSDVNAELIDELEEEAVKGNITEVRAIAKDLKENEEKIKQHGQRADAIVKGMLQHSRVTTGQKEQLDINVLVDEYLRLSYHGMRAKDKAFVAALQTEFDESSPNINVVPQDIGRVLLNLFNNAFYAVNEKKKQAGQGYEPKVLVSTKRLKDRIEIVVKDNGDGVPDEVVDKIFHPFFTTKPTGQGTGLGLSVSYDIIKAHGGELKVETTEGEGAKFIIQLPIK